jgi:hypothetical protein
VLDHSITTPKRIDEGDETTIAMSPRRSPRPVLFVAFGVACAIVAALIILPRQVTRPPAQKTAAHVPIATAPVPVVAEASRISPPIEASERPSRGSSSSLSRHHRKPSLPAGALLDRARDSLQTGDLAAAERDAHDAIHIGNARARARAHVIVGQIQVLRGKTDAAASEFADAIELDPANEAAAAGLARARWRQR